MGRDAFIEGLAKSKKEQPELKRFADYYFSTDLPIPDFELVEHGPQIADAWFPDDPEAAQQFLIFAENHDGSVFAIWDDGPIVYLASEYEGTSVIANSVAELLGLVAYGSDTFTIDIQYADKEEWQGCEEESEGLFALRTWLQENLQIVVPESPREVIRKARSQHPDLVQWIESRRSS